MTTINSQQGPCGEGLLALAARCEAAAGSSFALDTEIAYAINHPLEGLAKPYTASLDAAMSLVPEGCLWTMDSWSSRQWSAGIWRDRSWIVSARKERQQATPALALCAASLRARAARTTEPHND